MAKSRPRVLLLSPNPIGASVRGLAIRYTELARTLAAHADTHLAGAGIEGEPPADVEASAWELDRPATLRERLAGTDVVVTPPQPPHVLRELGRSPARVVVDLYDPELLELLERHRGRPLAERRLHARFAADRLQDALRAGHFFLCASERQRDLWVGAMAGTGMLTPAVYDPDPSLRSLIDVVPFGVPSQPPARGGGSPIRERFPELGADEKVVLWNGGIWRWLDAPAAIRAVAAVRERIPVRLVFMGASDEGGGAGAAAEARRVSAEAGDAALFNDAWVPYEHRAGWLVEADCAISAHRDHLETRFAFRTRLLDCLWAGLPPVVTGGDELAELVDREGLGATAPPGDVDALAEGVAGVLERGRGHYAEPLAAAAERYAWPRVAAPLVRFIERRDAPRRLGEGSPVPLGRRLRGAGQRLTRLARIARAR